MWYGRRCHRKAAPATKGLKTKNTDTANLKFLRTHHTYQLHGVSPYVIYYLLLVSHNAHDFVLAYYRRAPTLRAESSDCGLYG